MENKAVVYMTKDISSAGLMKVYQALGQELTGKVAVKLSTGEAGSNYLRPELIRDLVHHLDGTIVECNTAYGGARATNDKHLQTIEKHGFTEIAPVDIQDAEGSMVLPVVNGKHLKNNLVGTHFTNYDAYLILSHFKGHQMGGFGGAVKNMAIGLASSKGKAWIHSAGEHREDIFGADHDSFLESMAEAAKSVQDYLEDEEAERLLYVNVMNRLSVDCDCVVNPTEPDMHDIGILSSVDPVALDQACVDLVYAAPDSESLVERIESRNGVHTLVHAQALGLGSRAYELVLVD